jgi:hypothetical protein
LIEPDKAGEVVEYFLSLDEDQIPNEQLESSARKSQPTSAG